MSNVFNYTEMRNVPELPCNPITGQTDGHVQTASNLVPLSNIDFKQNQINESILNLKLEKILMT